MVERKDLQGHRSVRAPRSAPSTREIIDELLADRLHFIEEAARLKRFAARCATTSASSTCWQGARHRAGQRHQSDSGQQCLSRADRAARTPSINVTDSSVKRKAGRLIASAVSLLGDGWCGKPRQRQ